MTTLPDLTPYAGVVPDKNTQTKEEFANNVHPYLIYWNDTSVPELQNHIVAMNTLSGEVEARVVDCEAAATASEASAVNSSNSATESSGFADNSEASATASADSATSATASATASADSATSASASAESSSASAMASEASAVTAQSIIDNVSVVDLWVAGSDYVQYRTVTDPTDYKTYKSNVAITNDQVEPHLSNDWEDISTASLSIDDEVVSLDTAWSSSKVVSHVLASKPTTAFLMAYSI